MTILFQIVLYTYIFMMTGEQIRKLMKIKKMKKEDSERFKEEIKEEKRRFWFCFVIHGIMYWFSSSQILFIIMGVLFIVCVPLNYIGEQKNKNKKEPTEEEKLKEEKEEKKRYIIMFLILLVVYIIVEKLGRAGIYFKYK